MTSGEELETTTPRDVLANMIEACISTGKPSDELRTHAKQSYYAGMVRGHILAAAALVHGLYGGDSEAAEAIILREVEGVREWWSPIVPQAKLREQAHRIADKVIGEAR